MIRIFAQLLKEACELLPGIDLISVMIYWGVTYDGVTSLHFYEELNYVPKQTMDIPTGFSICAQGQTYPIPRKSCTRIY